MASDANSHRSSNILTDALHKKASRSPSQHHKHTTILQKCCKLLQYTILYALSIIYLIIWIMDSHNNNKENNGCSGAYWNIFGSLHWIEYRILYSLLGIALHLFLIVFCLIFLYKYLMYAQQKQIQQHIKNAQIKNINTLNKYKKHQSRDLYDFYIEYHQKEIEKQELATLSSMHRWRINNNHSLLQHIKLASCMVCELFLSLFFIEYNEFNIMAMFALTYYIFNAILYINTSTEHDNNDANHTICDTNAAYNDIIFAINCIFRGFSIVLPGICVNICQKWKCVQNEYCSTPEISVTFKGDKFEKRLLDETAAEDTSSSVQTQSKSEQLIFMEIRSIFKDKYIRLWILSLFIVEVFIFTMQPVVNSNGFRYDLDALYDCHCKHISGEIDCEQSMECKHGSITYFTINELILRQFVAMTLIATCILLLSFEDKYHVSRLDAIRYLISPSSIAVLILITLCEMFWWSQFKETIVMIWSVVYGVTAVIQCVILFALLDIQHHAHLNQDRLYGFKQIQPFLYFIEGVIAIGATMICLLCFIFYNRDNNHSTYIIIRGSGMLLFNMIELAIVIPLRTIAISPNYKSYFKQQNKKKYVRSFRWICFLNICNITYSAAFICNEFHSILTDFHVLNTSALRATFAFSFGSIYFAIWGLSQLLPWLIPNEYDSSILYTYNPCIDSSEISYITQYRRVDKSRLGINSNISPPPSSNMVDVDSIKCRLNRSKIHKQKTQHAQLKERRINIESFDESGNDHVQSSNIKYEDVANMFNLKEKQMEKDVDNANVNQVDKLKSFAFYESATNSPQR